MRYLQSLLRKLGEPLAVSFRLQPTFCPGCRSLMYLVPTDNADHQAINHFQLSAFCIFFFHVFHWKENPAFLKFLISLVISRLKDLCAMLPIPHTPAPPFSSLTLGLKVYLDALHFFHII